MKNRIIQDGRMNSVHRDYQEFNKMVARGKRGEAVYIKNSLNKVDRVYNIMQSRFTLLGSTSGAGKSSFIDDDFILKPWSDHVVHDPSIHWEVNYYSMERKKVFKHARWLSWMLYRDKGWLVSVEALLGWDTRGLLSEKVYDVVATYNDEMSELLDRVRIYDGRVTAATIKKHIVKAGKKLGVLYKADAVGVMKDDGLIYEVKFDPKNTREVRGGGREMFVELTHKGEKFSMIQDTHRYFLHNPNTFCHFVLDGLGLIDGDFGSTKQAVDDAVNVLADARDIYGFSPVVVSQFNRGIADIQRLKHHGSNMGPQESDFKDSGNAYQAADLALAIFDPFKFKAYDSKGMFGGYDVLNGMVAPAGHCRFRTLHVLKNTFGIDGAIFGMKYVGESSYFETLPSPNSADIHAVYSKIAEGL
jgi:hypothetical protein